MQPNSRPGSPNNSDSFSAEELTRYSRHLFLKEVGRKGQLRLKQSRVLVVGSGGLGSPLLLYLAAAGVGHLAVLDDDTVQLSNLQRQILFRTADLDQPKAVCAAKALCELNPDIEVQALPLRLNSDNALGLLRGYDLIVEGSDNFPTKFLTNDTCVLLGQPLLIGGILRFEGQVQWVLPGSDLPCYRCIFDSPPPERAVPSCSEAGVLGATAGLIGSWMAASALKFLLGLSNPEQSNEAFVQWNLYGNLLGVPFRSLELHKNPDCPLCGTSPTITQIRPDYYKPASE